MTVTVDGKEVEVTLTPMCGMPPGTRSADANDAHYDVDVYLDGKRVLDVQAFDIDRGTVDCFVVDRSKKWLAIFKQATDGKPLVQQLRGRVEVVDLITGTVHR